MSVYSKFSRGWCSPERYIQGPGEFENLKFYSDKFGRNIAVFIDGFLYEDLKKRLREIYNDCDHEIVMYAFRGEVTETLIEEKTEELKSVNPDVVMGIGGGKTIDVAKAVGSKLQKPFIIVPTIAATDAPSSSLSVIYREDGAHSGEFFYDHSPSILVVDSKLIANAPVRFLVSGMGDALATLIEADSTRKSNTPNLVYHKAGGFRQTLAGQAIARACYESLLKYGEQAKIACERHVVTEALENIIETNILLSGLGFENNATSGAHSVNDGLTSLKDGYKTMHGEKVAFGCIVQLIAECASKEYLEEVTTFCLKVGLPVCFEDLGIEATEENMRKAAAASMHSNWSNMPFDVNEETVYAAIVAADAYGKKRKEAYQKNV